MKRLFMIAVVLCGTMLTASAQVTAPEPEYLDGYCVLTSDSTCEVLPKETGKIGKHKTKFGKITGALKNAGTIASIAGGLGGAIGISTGSMAGIQAMKVGAQVGTIGDVAENVQRLGGIEGHDFIFEGAESSYVIPAGQDVRVLVKEATGDNSKNPMELYRVVRFDKTKKERRFLWKTIQTPLLGTKEASKSGYVNFNAEKYGKGSFLLTIPTEQLEKGEYGIVYVDIAVATTIPIGTFSIQ